MLTFLWALWSVLTLNVEVNAQNVTGSSVPAVNNTDNRTDIIMGDNINITLGNFLEGYCQNTTDLEVVKDCGPVSDSLMNLGLPPLRKGEQVLINVRMLYRAPEQINFNQLSVSSGNTTQFQEITRTATFLPGVDEYSVMNVPRSKSLMTTTLNAQTHKLILLEMNEMNQLLHSFKVEPRLSLKEQFESTWSSSMVVASTRHCPRHGLSTPMVSFMLFLPALPL